jgi:hypothetical protein
MLQQSQVVLTKFTAVGGAKQATGRDIVAKRVELVSGKIKVAALARGIGRRLAVLLCTVHSRPAFTLVLKHVYVSAHARNPAAQGEAQMMSCLSQQAQS